MHLHPSDFHFQRVHPSGLGALLLSSALLGALWTTTGEARTIIVAADSSGEFTRIRPAVDSAATAGDTVLVRDGYYPGPPYWGEEFIADSGLVVMAEHPGGAWVLTASLGVTIRDSAKLIGFELQSYLFAHVGNIVRIEGGPATLYNCRFHCAEPNSIGSQLGLACNGQPPLVRACAFQFYAAPWSMIWNEDSTTIWLPDNFFEITDTTYIHYPGKIRDGSNHPGLGHIYVSPVLETFEWLRVEEHPSVTRSYSTFSISPNPAPAGTLLRLNLPEHVTGPLVLYDLLGREVWRGEVATQVQLPRELASGIYFLSATVQQQRISQNLLIVR